MGRDLAIAGAGSLTPAEIEVALLVLQTEHERQLDPDTFAAVERFALAPCPVLALPTQDEFRKVIHALAGVLKTPRISLEQGQLQLAAYWMALKDVALYRLQRAGEHFIKTAEWMPTPGQIRTKALTFTHDVELAHSRARRLARDRRHRLHEELMRAIDDRRLTQAELDQLPAEIQTGAVNRHLLVHTPEGGVVYRSAEALARWEEHQRQLTRQFLLENRKDQ